MGWMQPDRTCLSWAALPLLLLTGCGTTKWTDTSRTATEQLLISDAVDRAVSSLDLRALAGKRVFLDSGYLKGVTDSEYLVSTIRQHALANGVILLPKIDEADYVLEIRVGAVGTDHHDVLLGIPATTVPTGLFATGTGNAQLPELALMKKTDQRAVAKVGLFAYNRHTGRPVWQSGTAPAESSAKALWFVGAGPFRRGKIFEGTRFGGDKVNIPLVSPGGEGSGNLGEVSVASEAYFVEPPMDIARRQREFAGATGGGSAVAVSASLDRAGGPAALDAGGGQAMPGNSQRAPNDSPATRPAGDPTQAGANNNAVSPIAPLIYQGVSSGWPEVKTPNRQLPQLRQ